MDIFEFAVEQERQLEAYYRQLTEIAPHPAIRSILKGLSNDEQLHVLIMERLKERRPIKVVNSGLAAKARSALKYAEQAMDEWGIDLTELDIYERAKTVELQKERFYLDRARESRESSQREIFEKLAAQEHAHYEVMCRLCELLGRATTHVARTSCPSVAS